MSGEEGRLPLYYLSRKTEHVIENLGHTLIIAVVLPMLLLFLDIASFGLRRVVARLEAG